MRGAHGGFQRGDLGVRIIPADAGSTKSPTLILSDGMDHPRGCGEHWRIPLSWLLIRGSSPRMRGALNGMVNGVSIYWIIPADAGSTNVYGRAQKAIEDHPRGCGEHFLR